MSRSIRWLLALSMFGNLFVLSTTLGASIDPVWHQQPVSAQSPSAHLYPIYLPALIKPKITTLMLGYQTDELTSYQAIQWYCQFNHGRDHVVSSPA